MMSRGSGRSVVDTFPSSPLPPAFALSSALVRFYPDWALGRTQLLGVNWESDPWLGAWW